ncbi:dienelactone hydrolase family protein [Parvularcula dongshanensis]|uniref:Dienelactone hydrolase n=1 Tax=Parvularcula dongshanensis TaxID=1173995 RepID=A0A840I736_9PROT|nr:dienelactone hydrolase family protein [Parvularcula dongshanensis]MBB4660135.1 dienelactone hydrolase [Parvularcula dongshanensis]
MVTTRTVEYEVDGETYQGLLAVPDGQGPFPCVMICHAWAGRAENEDKSAEKIAGMGYLAFAADVYGKGRRGSSTEENQKLMEPLVSDRTGLLAKRLSASLETMKAQDEADASRAAVTGFCFGGLCALDCARGNLGVAGAAAFHAILGQQDKPQAGDIEAKVIAFQGYDDPMAKPEDQKAFADEMTARKADWQLHLYGGVMHAFTNEKANDPDFGTVYDAQASKRAWDGFARFLAELFG